MENSWFDDFSINKKNICCYIMECKTQIVVHNWKVYPQLHNLVSLLCYWL